MKRGERTNVDRDGLFHKIIFFRTRKQRFPPSAFTSPAFIQYCSKSELTRVQLQQLGGFRTKKQDVLGKDESLFGIRSTPLSRSILDLLYSTDKKSKMPMKNFVGRGAGFGLGAGCGFGIGWGFGGVPIGFAGMGVGELYRVFPSFFSFKRRGGFPCRSPPHSFLKNQNNSNNLLLQAAAAASAWASAGASAPPSGPSTSTCSPSSPATSGRPCSSGSGGRCGRPRSTGPRTWIRGYFAPSTSGRLRAGEGRGREGERKRKVKGDAFFDLF